MCNFHSIFEDNLGEAPVHGYNGPLILYFTFCLPLTSFFYCFFFSLKTVLLLFSYIFWLCFLEESIQATCTTSSLKYLLLNNIPSEGGSVDDNGSHVLLWFSPVNLLVISACCLFLAPWIGKKEWVCVKRLQVLPSSLNDLLLILCYI